MKTKEPLTPSPYSERGIIRTEFLKEYPLQCVVFEEELETFRKLFAEINRDYVLLLDKEEKESALFGNKQRYIMHLRCPTTNFAEAYYQWGRKWNHVVEARKF